MSADAEGERQRGGGQPTLPGAPWSGTRREEDKTRLWSYLSNTPEGVPLSGLVSHVFGAASGDYSNTDYKFAKRFLERREEFLIARQDGNLWVEPTISGLHLNRSKQSVETRDGAGEAESRASSFAGKHMTIGSDATRSSLLRSLAAKREGTEDRFNVFERVRGEGAEYLALPYSTRFNSKRRVSSLQARYREAFEEAGERFDHGVMLTVTTDPGNFESIAEAAESLMATKNALTDRFAYDPETGPSRPGRRLPSIAVPEFTDSGLPHIHIVYFGTRWLEAADSLSNYLADRQGRVFHATPIANRGGEWAFSGRERAESGREGEVGEEDGYSEGRARSAGGSVSQYLSKTLRVLDEFADTAPAELHDMATSGKEISEFWKLTLYWATNLRFFTRSPSLSESKNDEKATLPHITCWRFVGAAQYKEIPSSVRAQAIFITRSGNTLDPPH
ncbi:hypothetical protein DMJ13_03590 [halophilic archaeon]|nr:hypothetical protein DMJ13_03590 [halophilic archaeon]